MVTTRRSTRIATESQEHDQEEESHSDMNEDEGTEQDQNHPQQNTSGQSDRIITIRIGGVPFSGEHDKASGRLSWRRDKPVTSFSNCQIFVPRNLTEENLAWCIIETLGIRGQAHFLDINDGRSPISGLFRERDNLFIPLSHVLSHPSTYKDDILCLHRPVHQEPAEKMSKSWTKILANFIGLKFIIATSASGILHSHYGSQWLSIEFWFASLLYFWNQFIEQMLEAPLKKLYKYGPSTVGWEGASLPSICSRITYHGDFDFWTKNWEECERIYRMKETSILMIWKPIFYVFIVFFIVMSVSWMKRRPEKKPDPNMVETFQAFNMIARQISRAFK